MQALQPWPMGQDVLQQTCAGVVPVAAVVRIGTQRPTTLRVEVPHTFGTELRHIEPAEHRQHTTHAELVIRLMGLDVCYHRVLRIEELVDALLDERVGLHEHEAVREQVPQLIDRHNMLDRAELVSLSATDNAVFVRVFGEFGVEVDDLSFGIVDDFHARQFSTPRQLVAIVEDGDGVVHAAMLADREHRRLGQFGRVIVDDDDLLFHSSSIFTF